MRLVLTLFALGFSVPAAGQVAGPFTSSTPLAGVPRSAVGPGTARYEMLRFANCTLKVRRAAAMRFLTAVPGTPEAATSGTQAASGECVEFGPYQVQQLLFRGALFEALYLDRFGNSKPEGLADRPPLALWAVDGPDTVPANELALLRFGECAVRANPGAAHTVVTSRPGTATEATALGILNPAFSSCLPADQMFKFTRSRMRGALAEALYRLRDGPLG